MKNLRDRLTIVAAFLCIGAAVMAAAPSLFVYYTNTGAKSVTAQHSASSWTLLDSLIPVCTDSAGVMLVVSGIAVLDPNDRFYFGFSGDSSKTVPELCTLQVDGIEFSRGQTRVPFCFTYLKANDAALTDTVFIYGACGGGGIGEAVALEDVVYTAEIIDEGWQ